MTTPALSRLLRGHPVPPAEALRGGAGALLAITATGLLARFAVSGHPGFEPLLIAPIGASAVLVCALPASPLAQPRAVIGGNCVSALIGLACAFLIPPPLIACGVAVGLAILVMSLLGCLHPPGGAVALGAVLAGAPTLAGFALPVAVCSLLLVICGGLYVNLTGRSYPHRPPVQPAPNAHATRDPPPAERVGYTAADLDTALARYGELLDVSREDLDALFREVERQAHRRIHSQIACEEIMSRDVIAVDLNQSCASALAFLRSHDLRAAPVVDAGRRVVGMVRRAELAAGRDRPVETALDPFVHRVRPGTPIEALLPILSSGTVHEAMVVDADRVLLGVITQTDLLGVLYRAHIVEAVFAKTDP